MLSWMSYCNMWDHWFLVNTMVENNVSIVNFQCGFTIILLSMIQVLVLLQVDQVLHYVGALEGKVGSCFLIHRKHVAFGIIQLPHSLWILERAYPGFQS